MAVSTIKLSRKIRGLTPLLRYNDALEIWRSGYESLQTEPVRALNEWVATNVFLKVGTNSIKTEDVLIRIATGMINNLEIERENKDLIYRNLIHYRQIMRQEWTLQSLKAAEELPF